MKPLHIFILCSFSVLSVAASAELEVRGHVGGEVSIHCFGPWMGNSSSEHSRAYFCRRLCSSENILLQAERKASSVTRRGRYSAEVQGGDGYFTVTIKKLRRTDTGTYQCGVGTNVNVVFQNQVNLTVLDAPTVFPGSLPSTTTTLQTRTESMAGGRFPSSTEPSTAASTLASSEERRNQQGASRLTDTTVVIIVSGSLAFLVCAIIPLIFYGHWRSNADGSNRPETDKGEGDYCEGDARVEVGLQSFEARVEPETSAPDSSQYAAIYQGLDPKGLE